MNHCTVEIWTLFPRFFFGYSKGKKSYHTNMAGFLWVCFCVQQTWENTNQDAFTRSDVQLHCQAVVVFFNCTLPTFSTILQENQRNHAEATDLLCLEFWNWSDLPACFLNTSFCERTLEKVSFCPVLRHHAKIMHGFSRRKQGEMQCLIWSRQIKPVPLRWLSFFLQKGGYI